MGKKPTGGKNGAPKKPINNQLLEELYYKENTGSDWDKLFDLYIDLEARGVPSAVLSSLENLISMEADLDTLEIREKVIYLSHRLCQLNTVEDQIKTLEIHKADLIKLRSKAPFEDYQIMISKVIGEINSLIESCNYSHLHRKEDLEDLYNCVGKIKCSEALWILQFLDNLAKGAFRRGNFLYKTTPEAKKLSTMIVSSRLREEGTLLGIAYEVFEKVFRSATYNQYRSKGEKEAYLNNSFYLYYLDQYKRLYKETDTEDSYKRWVEDDMPEFTPPKRNLPPKKKKSA